MAVMRQSCHNRKQLPTSHSKLDAARTLFDRYLEPRFRNALGAPPDQYEVIGLHIVEVIALLPVLFLAVLVKQLVFVGATEPLRVPTVLTLAVRLSTWARRNRRFLSPCRRLRFAAGSRQTS